ncbi:MAG TPA: helix-turn-helix transcriptional regulator [Thermoanaerobaculia bacterium]|nr:helix-turn-helix transcriptional regulator [Thermoanaerobaculia bacterium]
MIIASGDGSPAMVETPSWPAPPASNGEFGERLRRLRESRRLSVRRLARLVAVSPSYLSRIERNHVPPPSERTIARIARALTIETDDLLAAAGRMPEDVGARVLRRPRLMAKLVRLADALPDEKLDELCGELERDS